ncbi:type II toxin-antitoxin system prevent-host-death family antitoxin [Massilia sp. RP-1-19]|uniref:Antitoxin n=1 Tax=Massilia polaris TaxID=2728846 RepID=A0A848HM38_9BURK|nr:type II toxin-antitoxin system prevent-host-death family antitoxin [Massilia polaris]NML61189.1 type II toxin-antitoxin system prevent-host-death family antitoxin [Massilia polaris]
MKRWRIQDAKARFPELIHAAAVDGPQDITHHGKSVAVVLSRDAFDCLSQNSETLVAFMQRSPLYDLDELELDRAL